MDPLDWVHQWENYEMVMYVSFQEGDDGIFIQISERNQRDGAEEWQILYDRKISPLPPEGEISYPVGSEDWEERVLRNHLNAHPNLVPEEKAYLTRFLEQLDSSDKMDT